MTIERFTDLQGRQMAGFFVRNRAGKALAIGAFSRNGGFVHPTHKRYARDLSLCEALAKITGLPVSWNLSFYGRHVSSHGRQDLDKIVRKCWRCKANIWSHA